MQRAYPLTEYVGAVRIPVRATLRKYGLTEDEWRALLTRAGGACEVCHTVPTSGGLHIDHHHARLWRKMAPADKKRYVRGLLCWNCNSVWLRRGATPERLRAAADYLERYENATKGLV